MRILSPALIALVLLVPAGLVADVIVLNDGRVFEVEGPIRFEGDFVHFRLKSGQDVTFRRFEVDENKTRGLNKVLESDIHGLPRLRQVEQIEGQRARTVGRSIPMVQERPPRQAVEEVAEEREPRERAARGAAAGYPAGDYPVTVQADRVSLETAGDDAEEAERAAQRAERRLEREAAREARQAEYDAARREREEARARSRAEREAEIEAAEEESAPPAAERRGASSGDDPRVESYRERIAALDEQIDETRTELRRLTDLQKDAEAEFEGERLRSVDEEIDRLLHRISRLESRKTRLETRLQQFESQ